MAMKTIIKLGLACVAWQLHAQSSLAATQSMAAFEQHMQQLKERMEARAQTAHEIELHELMRARAEAATASSTVKSQIDEASSFLQKTFEQNRREREQLLQDVEHELVDLRKEIGARGNDSIYDQWLARQERQAERMRESLSRERELRRQADDDAKKELDAKRRHEQRGLRQRFIQEKEAEHRRAVDEGRYYYLQQSPHWPLYARPFDREGFFFAQVGFQNQFGGLSPNGDRQKLAELEYSPDKLTFKDLVVESRLLASGTAGLVKDKFVEQTLPLPPRPAPDRKYNPLYILRDASITLESSRYQMPINTGFLINIGDRRTILSTVFSAAYIYRHLDLKMAKQTNVLVPAGANSYPALALALQKYIDAPLSLLKEMFDKRGLDLNATDRHLDLCGVKISLHRSFDAERLNGRFVFGAVLGLPVYARDGDDAFQLPRIDSVRFPSLGLYAAGYCKYSPSLAPHAFIEFATQYPTSFMRRLPYKKSYNPDAGDTLPLLMTNFVQDTTPSKTAFSDYIDSNVALFAEQIKPVKIFRSLEFTLILGNEIAGLFDYSAFFDICYRLNVRAADSIRLDEDTTTEWVPEKLLFQPTEMRHTLTADWRYQGSDKATFDIGGACTLFGYNTPATFEVHIAAHMDF